jgi:hypothetical protein
MGDSLCHRLPPASRARSLLTLVPGVTLADSRSPQALCFRPLRGLRTFACDVYPRGRARSGGRACVCLEGGLLIDESGRGQPRSDGRASVFLVVRLLIHGNFAKGSSACRDGEPSLLRIDTHQCPICFSLSCLRNEALRAQLFLSVHRSVVATHDKLKFIGHWCLLTLNSLLKA